MIPGKLISDELKTRGLTVESLANSLGLSKDDVDKLIAGETKIDSETSAKLGKFFGTSKKFFVRLQEVMDSGQ